MKLILVLPIQVNLDAAGTEEKEMKDPEELNTSENKVESAPASGTTSSSTSFEGEERIKEGERSNGNVSPCESTVICIFFKYIRWIIPTILNLQIEYFYAGCCCSRG